MDEASYKTEWTERDFDALSWHDCFVHRMRVQNPQGAYDSNRLLDIDFVLEWIEQAEGTLQTTVAPALLAFRLVDNLRIDISLSYKEEFVIDRIERSLAEPGRGVVRDRYRYGVVVHSLDDGPSSISLEARGFRQKLTRQPPGPMAHRPLEQHER